MTMWPDDERRDGEPANLGLQPPLRLPRGLSDRLARSVLARHAGDELRIGIVSGRLQRGTPLVEQQLASIFGTSRGPIRTALQELHAQGLVETAANGRSHVAGFDHRALIDLLNVRLHLEGEAIRWGLREGVDAEGVCLAYAEMEQARAGSLRDLAEIDVAFHRALIDFSESRGLLRAWEALAPVVTAVIEVANRSLGLDGGTVHAYLVRAHAPIVDAILAGDPDAANTSLREQFSVTDYFNADRVPRVRSLSSAAGDADAPTPAPLS